MKLIGYVNMKKQEGKILFVTDDSDRTGNVVGESCDKVFVFGEEARGITNASIGHDIVISYRCGFNGRAYVAAVDIK